MIFATESLRMLAGLRIIKQILENKHKNIMLFCAFGSYFQSFISNLHSLTTF